MGLELVDERGGGYVPLLLAALVYGIMLIWHRGSITVAQRLGEQIIPVDEFMRWIKSQNIPRVPGTGVFLTRTAHDAPPVIDLACKTQSGLARKSVRPERRYRIDTVDLEFGVLVQSLNLGPIWQASDSLSPRAPGSARRPFLKFAPEPLQEPTRKDLNWMSASPTSNEA